MSVILFGISSPGKCDLDIILSKLKTLIITNYGTVISDATINPNQLSCTLIANINSSYIDIIRETIQETIVDKNQGVKIGLVETDMCQNLASHSIFNLNDDKAKDNAEIEETINIIKINRFIG